MVAISAPGHRCSMRRFQPDPAMAILVKQKPPGVLYLAKRQGNLMQDLERALTDISAIREQLAHTTEFRGYAPTTLAATGAFAFAVAGAQAHWLPESASHMGLFVAVWAAAAAVCVILIAFQTVQHSR